MEFVWTKMKPFHPLCVIVFLLTVANAALVNVTVDDSGVDPIAGNEIEYGPSNGWKSSTTTTSEVYNGTWHWYDYDPSETLTTGGGVTALPHADFSFNGSAVYVYCVIASNTRVNLSFVLDGVTADGFNSTVLGPYRYSVPVLSRQLNPEFHNLSIVNLGMWPNGTSELTLDAIVYARANNATTSTNSTGIPPDLPPGTDGHSQPGSGKPIGAIVGGVIGGVIFVIMVILVICFWNRISGWCRGLRTPPPAMVVQEESPPRYQVHEEKSGA
ncbi:hypothetical protein AN958_01253 [Leucoagaricus sp. SymC.cos]|nr:hypothetical protein AN958_01253 [Leucoagaricus sp. SymC.cos]